MENAPNVPVKRYGLSAWRRKNRFRLQCIALAASVLAPFALYWALQSGDDLLASMFFAVIALSMAVTAWVG